MSEDVLHRLGHALAVSYDNMIPEPLSEKLRDRVLELAVAEALVERRRSVVTTQPVLSS